MPAAIISDRLWKQRFAADPAAVGKTITLNGTGYIVVGILQPGFRFEDTPVDVYTTLGRGDPLIRNHRTNHDCIARLAPAVDIGHARAEMNVAQEHIDQLNPATEKGLGTSIVQSSGDSLASEPFGYYAPYAPVGITPIVYAVEWSQTSTYTNVDVFANLFTPGSPGTVNYSLVTAIGSGTSFANNGIAHGSATTPVNPADVDLFHLDSLGPGTHFLVLDSPVPNTSRNIISALRRNS